MKREQGFSLVEMVIVVAIVAILAGIALPSYFSHVSKGYRSDAMGALTAFAQAMERHFTINGTYIGADGGTVAITSETAPTIFPTEAPIDGSNKVYDLLITEASATSYTLIAKPKAGGRMKDDGIIGLKSTGVRGWDKDGDTDPFGTGETCWDSDC
ncbi:type IV pilin protein [Halioxenophilus sp. WMMB6]|uniref:type IV pilin protein n=1 Tax=Halioxenophilus sp. WMMB6 TaxID=3073815 RepID=UPI00295ECE4A|nr:type IV pilin protein [Halioxenophilus sp. WMMB6]